MVIPGYDPEDVDEILESYIGTGELGTYLTDEELVAYRNGEESLVDLLDGGEIQQLLDDADVAVDVPD